MTEQENQKNMEQCSKFESCDIPRCPLDLWMNHRIELNGDPKCPNLRFLKGRIKSRRMSGHIMPSLRDRVRVIGEYRKQVAKTDIL